MVFNISNAINHGSLPFLAAFHKAMPFQHIVQIANIVNNKTTQGLLNQCAKLKSCNSFCVIYKVR